MKLSDLPPKSIPSRLKNNGLLLHTGPFTFRIGTSLSELFALISLLYLEYELVEEEGIVDFEIRVEPVCRFWPLATRRAVVLIDGRQRFEPFDRRIALPMLEWGINWCTFSRPNQYLLLHAAVVEHGEKAFIFPGPPGSGKSTLCAAMVLRGWRLLSDELAVMRPGTTDLIPVPRPIGLKEASIEIIRRFEPKAVLSPPCPGTHKGTVAHLRPPENSISRCDDMAHPRWIVFPVFQPGCQVELLPISRALTLLDLAEDSFNYSVLGRDAFETLADLVDRCECFELRYGTLDEALDILNTLAAIE